MPSLRSHYLRYLLMICQKAVQAKLVSDDPQSQMKMLTVMKATTTTLATKSSYLCLPESPLPSTRALWLRGTFFKKLNMMAAISCLFRLPRALSLISNTQTSFHQKHSHLSGVSKHCPLLLESELLWFWAL